MDLCLCCAACAGCWNACGNLLKNALAVGVYDQGRLHLLLVVRELENVLAFLGHIDSCWPIRGSSAESAVFFEESFRCVALQAHRAKVPFVIIVLLSKKTAQTFYVAVVIDWIARDFV